MQKCDKVTSFIFQHMDVFNLEPTENFMVSKKDDTHSLLLWGNTTKNPRYKSIDMPESILSMSIPKPLSLANVGVRLFLDSHCDASVAFEEQSGDRHMSVVGSVLYLDLVELPDMAKTVDKWTLRPSKKFLYFFYKKRKHVYTYLT
jgi:hypothetical protein